MPRLTNRAFCGVLGVAAPLFHDPPDGLAKGDAPDSAAAYRDVGTRNPFVWGGYKKYFIRNDQLPVQ